jgi:hypothetical protein
MKKVYVIDACSLIEAAHNYNLNKKAFSNIWNAIEDKIKTGELISSSEILDELKDKDLSEWAKKHKEAFIPLTEEIQLKTKEILKKHKSIIKIKSNQNSNGDPFLIATAVVYNGVIVTEEGLKVNGIPHICKELEIECIKLNKYLDIILE